MKIICFQRFSNITKILIGCHEQEHRRYIMSIAYLKLYLGYIFMSSQVK